jgi:pimeloyl-ACP methyl ester carboxylesterase
MPTLFLHAFPFDPRMWGELPAGAEAPRLYELGDSIDDWAASILERYPGELTLVGASMGGYVAYAIAAKAPERVRGLLTAGSRGQADPPGARRRRDQDVEVVRTQGLDALWERLRPNAFSEHASDDVLARARAWANEQDPDDVVRALVAMRDRRDTTDAIKALDPPPWIVLGELDPLARPGDFAGVLDPEHLRIVPGCGHVPSLEQPQAFQSLVEEFLAWTRSPQTS